MALEGSTRTFVTDGVEPCAMALEGTTRTFVTDGVEPCAMVVHSPYRAQTPNAINHHVLLRVIFFCSTQLYPSVSGGTLNGPYDA